MSKRIQLPPIEPFKSELLDSHDMKGMTLKVLEEAAEVFGAYQDDDSVAMRYELADVLQAVVNLWAMLENFDDVDDIAVDMIKKYALVHSTNNGRGRYADE